MLNLHNSVLILCRTNSQANPLLPPCYPKHLPDPARLTPMPAPDYSGEIPRLPGYPTTPPPPNTQSPHANPHAYPRRTLAQQLEAVEDGPYRKDHSQRSKRDCSFAKEQHRGGVSGGGRQNRHLIHMLLLLQPACQKRMKRCLQKKHFVTACRFVHV